MVAPAVGEFDRRDIFEPQQPTDLMTQRHGGVAAVRGFVPGAHGIDERRGVAVRVDAGFDQPE
ncbi:MAG: hypothetical protein JNK87_35260 [Bryobacterales bacterium]|nr:hypothetical protein [Bryobacterales bacterium]